MHTLSQPYSKALSYLHRRSEPTFRVVPTRIMVKCSYGFESSSFSQGVGSACAILSSKVNSQNEDSNPAAAGENIAAVNGDKSAVTDLNLVHVGGEKTLPPKSLTISDLSPAPMHDSQVRVAYQGVPGAYSESAVGKAYPNGEAIACNQFEVVFQAIEL